MILFYHIGRYFIFLIKTLEKPEKQSVWWSQFLKELRKLGLSSVGIIILVSAFMGAVITIQTAYNMTNPLLPDYLVGLSTRDTLFLEFSSTIICIILAGKVGSNIASEIGSMRVTEQIDAMEVMGINAAQFLVSPKIFSFLFIIPILVVLSMIIGLVGGLFAAMMTGSLSGQDYILGLQYAFIPYYIIYSIIKSLFFAFIIVTISSYQGFYVSGGAIEVGKASTRAVVYSIVIILLFDLILTQLLLT
jgi:phospholipid/cholesterol/gamma-HCH transport system permease protein